MGERLELLRGKLREFWPYLAGVIFLLVAGAALIYLPEMLIPKEKYWIDTKTIFDIKNEARRTIAYIIGGFLAVIGIILTFRRIRALERQVQIAQEGQITERFTRAIEQLGSDKMEIRLGGIYALERIANDSDKDYWAIIETLTAYVRENARWQEPLSASKEQLSGEESAFQSPETETKPATDIQAVLTVLGRRKYRFGQREEKARLNLRETDLRGANLEFAHLEGAVLIRAHLEEAFLLQAHLEDAFLWEAHLEGAYLNEGYLQGADLANASLEWANFGSAHLEKANLRESHLEGAYLRHAQLQSANLIKAHLEGAKLSLSNLEGANLMYARLKGASMDGAFMGSAYLEKANLERTNLTYVNGLTMEQLTKAIIDNKSTLPDYLQEQTTKTKGSEGNEKE